MYSESSRSSERDTNTQNKNTIRYYERFLPWSGRLNEPKMENLLHAESFSRLMCAPLALDELPKKCIQKNNKWICYNNIQ